MTLRTIKYPKISYSQGQRSIASILLIVWLLAIGSPESVLAVPGKLDNTSSTPLLESQLPPGSPSSTIATSSTLEELIKQAEAHLLNDFTFGQRLYDATLQILSSKGSTIPAELLLKSLGTIALTSLAQGTDQMNDEQVRQAIIDIDSQITAEMLVDTGLLQKLATGQYQFPHHKFQEYFAGHALAQQFLSTNQDEQEQASAFLSENQYKNKYTRTLSFMAGEVSRIGKVEGLQKLLTALGKKQEIFGLQHLLLQLREC